MTNLICDLDGVLYRGNQVVEGVPEALKRLAAAGIDPLFVTNNSSRTPENVAAKIETVTGYRTDPERVVTSTMAAISMLDPSSDLPVLVVGEEGITALLERAGHPITDTARDARTVMVGVTPNLSYRSIAAAADAVRDGARFIATNLDPTFPIPNGFLPGAGAVVAAIATAGGRAPEVAGKPEAAMRKLVREIMPGPAWVVGDRLDSDIAMAAAESDWRSILVLTGATGADQPTDPADHVVADFGAAVDLIIGNEPLAEQAGA